MLRILFVSIAFPPKSDPEAIQAAKYFHYLQKFKDIEVNVVTSTIPTLYMPYDRELEAYAVGVKQLISITLRENRYVNYLLNRFGLGDFFFPDIKQSFHKQFRKVLKELNHKPDLIYSRSDPKSSTIMAYKLKQVLKAPWVLHMSDPWADCPINNLNVKQYEQNAKWERRCFEAADIITLTSIPSIEFYKKKYVEFSDKFRLYPNVFDDALQAGDSTSETFKSKFRIVYTGGLAGDRSPEFFLKPLLNMYRFRPEIADKIEVIFAGSVDSKNRGVFREYNLPFVNWIGLVPYQEALRLQKSADYLLLIDNQIDDRSMSMFFPSKLLDYMLARKRILAITTKGSASDLVLRDLKSDVISHNECDEIIDAVSSALQAFENGDREYLINEAPPSKYAASYNASRLYEEIKNLVHDK